MRKASSILEIFKPQKHRAARILRDNPILDRLIEVGTKALRRGLMSGETLRAPRQQLRRHRASAFDLSTKSSVIARLSGARGVLGSLCQGLRKRSLLTGLFDPIQIQKNAQVIRKILPRVSRAVPANSNRGRQTTLRCLMETPIA
ncbi:MAG: hypothetical protein ACR2H4_07160 [Pyrinomonadaceae bacterium]